MRISHRHRFIFFSNPKTGSESVRQLLDPYSEVRGVPYLRMTADCPFYSHMRPVEARPVFRQLGWDFDAYFKFTFVRNPWARLVSLYKMIHQVRRPMPRFAAAAVAAWRNATVRHPSPRGFRAWLRTIRTEGAGAGGADHERWRRFGTYSIGAFAGDGSGELLVDAVIRLEDIDREIPRVLRRIGIPAAADLQVPRINVRGKASYPTYYDRAAVDLVRRAYADDIRTYRYEFGD